MIKNYFQIACRNLIKNKVFSFINILGLTIGITVCAMIFLFIANQFSFDKFHSQGDRIYRVMRGFDNTKDRAPYLSAPYATALLTDYPDAIEKAVTAFGKVAPLYPFEYSFLDQKFDTLYKTDLRQQRILSLFSGLAIFIACLGLYGLASFTAAKRNKEIGIRKSAGRFGIGRYYVIVQRFYKTRISCLDNCLADCLARHEQMVGRFCLPHPNPMVVVCTRGTDNNRYRTDYGKLAGHSSSRS